VRRVTLDSNVIISALNFGGKPLEVLDLARAGQIENAISNSIITETSRILYVKLYWEPEDITDAVNQIVSFSKYVHPECSLNVVLQDVDDNRVLECALAAQSDTIVTGDTDLLVLGNFRGITIVKPSDYLEDLRSRTRPR
jgi:putative PIN family toxin of toxin-antitoxin system